MGTVRAWIRGEEERMRNRNRARTVVLGTLAVLIGFVAVPPAAQAAPRCFGKKATIVGTGDRDTLKGTPKRDVIVGLGGGDKINGRAGGDLICGGGGHDSIKAKAGNDRISGGPSGDFILGQQGNDELGGAGGGDAILAGPGNDRILGGPGAEFMIGGVGDDLFDGGSNPFDLASFEESPVGVVVDLNVTTPQNTGEGIDTLLGVEGLVGSPLNDALTGQNVPSQTGNGLFGFGGTDQVLGMDGNDVIDGEDGNDKGGPGVGLVNGGLGDDVVFGGFGDDDLYGEAGNDLLDGFEEGETTGDFGSGGPDLDECFGLETVDMTPGNECETNTPKVARRLARWRSVRSMPWA
jgi:Ca2+-binding RTX toxin-like protein